MTNLPQSKYVYKAMKNTCFIALFILGLSSYSCKKSTSDLSDDCVRVKLIGFLCGQANFQILDSKYDSFGEDGWKDGNGHILDHVFYSQLSCQDQQFLGVFNAQDVNGNGVIGKEVYLKIANTYEAGNCTTCKALLIGPATRHQVNIKASNCN